VTDSLSRAARHRAGSRPGTARVLLSELRPLLGTRSLKVAGAALACAGLAAAFAAPTGPAPTVALPAVQRLGETLVMTAAAAPHTVPKARQSFGVIGFVATPGQTKVSARHLTGPSQASRASRSANYSRAGLPGMGAMSDNAIAVINEVHASFPQLTNIGGYRPGDPGDHGTGHAVDVMCGRSDGDALAAHLQGMAGTLHIKYIIWRQRIWYPGGTWQPMADRGSTTANHYDHVHISVY
jgi:hypothetical protein